MTKNLFIADTVTATRLEAVEIYFSKDLWYFFSLFQKTEFYGGGGEGWEVGVQPLFKYQIINIVGGRNLLEHSSVTSYICKTTSAMQ